MSKSTTKNTGTSVALGTHINHAPQTAEGKAVMQQAEWFVSEASISQAQQGVQKPALVAVWLRR